MFSLQTILHPTDFSSRSDYAFHLACSLARDHGGKVIVLHVVPPPQMAAYDEVLIPPPMTPGREDELRTRLEQYRASDPQVPVEYRLEEGFEGTEIARVAKEVHADIIVMGTHGRTGLGRLLLGSVAENVLRHASCPVLTVKGPVAAVGAKANPAVPTALVG
jgi:nucleotide-binding universal stress UspA family protein